MRFPFFQVAFAFLGCVFAAAEEVVPPLHVDLQEAVQLALEKNFSIQVERFNPAIADARLLQQQGVFDPAFEMEVNRTQQEGPLADKNGDNDFYRAAIIGLLPWGMRYDLSAQNRRILGSRQITGDSFNSFAGLTVAQPLLRGFGPASTMARIRVARIGQALSEWDMMGRVIDIVSKTLLVYNDLYFSKLDLDVARRSRDLAGRLLEDNRRREEIGVMSPLDVTEARAELASRVEDVIVGERVVRENENELKRLITDDVSAFLDRKLIIGKVPQLVPCPGTVREGIAKALEIRPDFRRAMLELQQQKITLILEKSQGLPRLDLVASYGANGIDDGFRNSLQNIGDLDDTEWTVGAVLNVPFPNRAARGQVAATQVQIAKALVDLKRFEQDIIIEIDNAAIRIESTRQRIAATRESRALFEERLSAEDQKLKAGASTTFLVLQAQRALVEAEVSELRAMVDYNKSVVEYHRALGVTLEQNGIEVSR